ncbi:MAG TPA: hypothetical protein VEK11_01205 [Thermoanaerobaculia bacterium]|nr:hypothetical protein [Thermoanaerobaculia bacterium]
MTRALPFAFAVLFTLEAHAACTLNLQKEDLGRGKSWELSWNTQTGATRYTLESIRKSADGTTTIRTQDVTPRGGSTKVTKEVAVTTTTNLTVTYRVTAVGVAEPCSATIDVGYPTDSTLQLMSRRSTIPLVGSTRGANGSVFKTSLRLRATRPNQRGMLIFHPANTPGRDTDPSITYHLPGLASVLEFDDVVAEFGQSGIGSIDIVPDFHSEHGWTVPVAEVRLFNVTDTGTFGTIGWQTQVHDFHGQAPDAVTTLSVNVPSPELRLNLAVRSWAATTATVELFRQGSVIAFKEFDLDRDFLLFNSATAMLQMDVQPGDIITIRVPEGGAVPLYTLTDNRTNDPALFMPPVRVRHDLSHFDVGF